MGTCFGVSVTPPVIALVVLVTVAVLAIVAWMIGRGVRSVFTFSLICAGGAFTLLMLAVTILLVVKAWNDMGSGALATGAAPVAVPTAASAPTGAPAAEPKDAIANSMTAIGLTVAVVTLILTVATSWFAVQMQRVAKFEGRIDKGLRRLETAQESARLEREARVLVTDALPRAKMALHEWFVKRGESENAVALAQDFSLWLEMLAASASDIRFEAFGHLRVLGSGTDQESILAPVDEYTLRCHDLALNRLESDVSLSRRLLRDRLEQGLWCKVFDRVEQARYLALTARP